MNQKKTALGEQGKIPLRVSNYKPAFTWVCSLHSTCVIQQHFQNKIKHKIGQDNLKAVSFHP